MEGKIQKIINSKSQTFLAFCFCFILGAGISSLFDWPYGVAFYLFVSVFLIAFFLIIFWHNGTNRFFIACFLFLILGSWRFLVTIPNCGDAGVLCNYNGRQVSVTGWVSDEPDRRIDGARYVVSATSIAGNETRPLEGNMLITTRLYPEYHYGDSLKIKCRVEKPTNTDGSAFRYDKYLERAGVWSICNNPKINVIWNTFAPLSVNSTRLREGSPSFQGDPSSSPARALPQDDKWEPGRYVIQKIFQLKSIISTRLEKLWPEPESSFMAGLLYGSKSGLPPDVTANFSRTGVTHIIAVSGFNVTIIVSVLLWALIRLGLYRQQAFWVIVTFLIIFVIFSGATASVIRAALMGFVVLLAQQIGRVSRMANVLIFTVAVMMLQNPYLLLWDAGFQLSFLATLGLVYILPVLDRVIPLGQHSLFFPRDDALNFVREPLTQTLSAIIATLPLILYQFGRLSIVAPLVNVLILWTIPWLMLGGFIALVTSFIFYPLGQLAAWISAVGLEYVLRVVNWFGNQSWAAANFNLPSWAMVAMYVGLVYAIIKIKNKSEKIKITD